jgi:hypothetical protein
MLAGSLGMITVAVKDGSIKKHQKSFERRVLGRIADLGK